MRVALILLSVWILGYLVVTKFSNKGDTGDSTPVPTYTNIGTPCELVKIVDGDSVHLLVDNQKVKFRFWGIDTPEARQNYGYQATEALRTLLSGKSISIEKKDIDRYGRTVGILYANGRNVNVIMVKNGHAWWYSRYAPSSSDLKNAESSARKKKLGLWEENNPMPPWEWRRRN